MSPLTTLTISILVLSPSTLAQFTNFTECRVPANPDTLGLGVRLGLYFQLISNMLMNIVNCKSRKEAQDGFLPTAYFFASFIAAVIYSAARHDFAPGAIIACTWYPILLLSGLFSVDFRDMGEHEKIHRYLFAHMVWLASGCLNLWFWFAGVYYQHADQCMEPRVFFFANLSAVGGIRFFFTILNVVFVVAAALSLLYKANRQFAQDSRHKRLLDTLFRRRDVKPDLEKSSIRKANDLEAYASDQRPPTTLTAREHLRPRDPELYVPEELLPASDLCANTALGQTMDLKDIKHPLQLGRKETVLEKFQRKTRFTADFRKSFGSLLLLLFYIVAAELQISFNNLDGIGGIDSTGQIIPLGLGSLSLIRSLWLLRRLDWKALLKLLKRQRRDRLGDLKT